MAGRNHTAGHALSRQPIRAHPALIEEQQHREIQTLLLDNHRLAATHVALKQELAAVHLELRHLSATASTVKTESDAQVREVYEKSIKLESELRMIQGFGSELVRVKDDIRKLDKDKREMEDKLTQLKDDVAAANSDLAKLPEFKEEIQAMDHEIYKGRAAIEYEKKMQATNIEVGRVMEEKMAAMAREIEKLHVELANAEKRARATAAAAAAAAVSPGRGYGIHEMGYVANSYNGHYAAHQGTADTAAQYVSGAPYGHYEIQQHHVHR